MFESGPLGRYHSSTRTEKEKGENEGEGKAEGQAFKGTFQL